MSKKTFKVGDRVVSKENDWTNGLKGTVFDIVGGDAASVKFVGARKRGWGTNEDCWCVAFSDLKRAPRSSTITLGTPNLAGDLSLPPQPRKILAHLEKGKTLTNMEAMITYHISRLSDCIFKLRKAGYDITMTEKRDEVGGKYASYKLAA